MGAMGAARKQYISSRTDSDWRAAKAQKNFAGFIFFCNSSTISDLDRNVFGLPAKYEETVRCIRTGMPLFLFNQSNRCLYGVFEAASDGGFNIDPYAWENTDWHRGRYGPPQSRFPAQVRVRIRDKRPGLDEDSFRPILDHVDGSKFKLDLTAHQVHQLLRLFGTSPSSQRELPVGKNGKNRPIPAIGFRDPESPRSTYKSESDYYSDSSSRGMNSGEDDWPDEALGEKVQYHQEELRLSHVSLSDSQTYENGHFEMPATLEDQPSACCYSGEDAAWKESFQGASYCPGSDYDNRAVLRLHENDPAVNSNSNNGMQNGEDHPILVNSPDNVLAMSMLPSQMQFTGNEKLILIPFQTVQCQQRESASYSGQTEATKWNNQRRSSRGSSINSQKQSFNQHRSKDARYQKQQMLPDSQQPAHRQAHKLQINQVPVPFCMQGPGQVGDQGYVATVLPDSQQSARIQSQKLQFNQVLVPFCTQGPGQEGDQGQTVLSPMFMPSNGAVDFAQLQTGGRADESSQGFEAVNDVQMLPERFQQFLQNGQGQILLVPSIIPRPSPVRPPATSITAELVEALHFEILHFAKLTRPSPGIQRHVEAAIDCVRKGVNMVWPEADVEVFGSFATGLCLQHSDVDLAVVDAPRLPGSESLTIAQVSATLIRELAAGLKTYEWCESINPLDTASMPVLKCLCRPFGPSSNTPAIAVDITIGGTRNSYASCPDQALKPTNRHTGGAAREYVLQKIRELPALAPLVLLLKSFLHHKGLSNVYTGGLGSFSLTLLVAFFLERIPSPSTGGCVDGRANDSPTSPSSSPLSCSSEFSDDSDAPSSRSSFGTTTSNSASDSGSHSLGEFYVRRAAGTIQRVLSVWDQCGLKQLGNLLLGFLQTFGCIRDLSREKIVLKGNGGPGGFFNRDDRHVALWIDDPLRPGINIGAGSFCMVHVQAAFREMLDVLSKYPEELMGLQCEDKDCQDLAAMRDSPCLRRLTVEAEEFQ